MSDQYLWDKSGAPDAETEKLERVLESLRYRPSEKSKSLILEATRDATRAVVSLAPQSTAAPGYALRRFTPAYAIAATILLAIVAGSLWMKMRAPHSLKTPETHLAATTVSPPEHLPHDNTLDVRSDYSIVDSSAEAAPTPKDSPKHALAFAALSSHKKQSSAAFERRLTTAPDRVANSRRSIKGDDALIVEGERAKERLVMALYIASEKLNFAQKKSQANKDNVPSS